MMWARISSGIVQEERCELKPNARTYSILYTINAGC